MAKSGRERKRRRKARERSDAPAVTSHDDNPGENGGQGALADEHHLRGDLQMVDRAVSQRWDIPEQVFRVLPQHATRIALDRLDGRPVGIREQLRAAEVLHKMHGQNQDQGQKHLHLHAASAGGDDPVTIYIPHNGRDANRNGHGD